METKIAINTQDQHDLLARLTVLGCIYIFYKLLAFDFKRDLRFNFSSTFKVIANQLLTFRLAGSLSIYQYVRLANHTGVRDWVSHLHHTLATAQVVKSLQMMSITNKQCSHTMITYL